MNELRLISILASYISSVAALLQDYLSAVAVVFPSASPLVMERASGLLWAQPSN